MGVIAKQSFLNLFSIGIGFLVGALNVLLLYPIYLGDKRQGLVVGLLAVSNLVQPFLSLGLQHALIKFYSSFSSTRDRDSFLWFIVLTPVLLLLALGIVYLLAPEMLAQLIPSTLQADFPYLEFVLLIAISTAYFELFNSWLRVHLKSVFANFLKELYPRILICILIGGFALGLYHFNQFLYYLIAGYYARLLLIIGYSLWVYRPAFYFVLPPQVKKIIRYSALIFLSGAAASFILDIDKAMLLTFSSEQVAYYSVAVYIAAVVEAPGRALFQIISPIVAEALNQKNEERILMLLKKSSANLLLISGGCFLVINLNLTDFYQLIAPEYQAAFYVVQLLSFGKLFSMTLGCLNQIISNSEYYDYVLFFSVFAAILAVLLNMYFIPIYGIMGAAYATLIVILVINSLKIGLIAWKMGIHPFSNDTLKIGLSIAFIAIAFYAIEFPFDPIVNIGLKSISIGLLYATILWFLGPLKGILSYLKKG